MKHRLRFAAKELLRMALLLLGVSLAAFALMTAENLFTGDPEQCAIHQEAYFSILQGESMKNVRFRYEKEMDAYVKEHMWDD